MKFQSSQISDLHCSKLTPTSWKCTTHDLHQSNTVLRPQQQKVSRYTDWKQTSLKPIEIKVWYSDVVKQSRKDMKSKPSPSLVMPSPLESKRPHHQSVQVPSPKMSGTDKLTRISQPEHCRGTSETPSSEQEFPQLCRDIDRLDLNLIILCCVRVYGPSQFLKII